MDQPFWQRSPERLTYGEIAAFIAEGIPEGDHLEYKLPTYNNSSHKVEFTPQFLETIVAFANTGAGMMIVGIREDPKTKRPLKIEGIDLSGEKRPRDLAISLRDACAQAIEPTVLLEARPFLIPEGEDAAGCTLLVVRVRRGLQPPYNLIQHGIFIRNGDRDDRARVRQIQALFAHQEGATGIWASGAKALERTFSHVNQHVPEQPAFLMVALAPLFPIEPVVIDEQSDRHFRHLGISLFGADYFVLEPHGIEYNPYTYDSERSHPPYGCAFDDGSIGIRFGLAAPSDEATKRSPRWRICLIWLWQQIRRVLEAAEEWPRGTCKYAGPLLCRVALGNLADVVLTLPDDWLDEHLQVPPVRNRLPGWSVEFEWDRGADVNDLLDLHLASLARQLQFAYYHSYGTMIYDAAAVRTDQ